MPDRRVVEGAFLTNKDDLACSPIRVRERIRGGGGQGGFKRFSAKGIPTETVALAPTIGPWSKSTFRARPGTAW